MSLPTQCELARRVKQTALAAATAATATATASPNPAAAASGSDSATEGPSAMEEEDAPAAEGGKGGGGSGNSEGVGVASATWAELLPVERNWHKTVYTLQIIDALLLPAPVGVFGSFIWGWGGAGQSLFRFCGKFVCVLYVLAGYCNREKA